ncbi:glycosyltransferase family 39 protein [Bdellovibrio sp. HCB2-146]|uniref:glycosyltransferase family 39 protein n=1 Tax=Bdellovibrio sp. HCB2-146 TaxID=3394362 RepID=UPI0039BD6720
MRKFLLNTNLQVAACLLGLISLISWFYILTPQWSRVDFTNSRSQTSRSTSPMIPVKENEANGIFWITLKNQSQAIAPDRLIMRVRGCITNFAINDKIIPLTSSNGVFCNRLEGAPAPAAISDYLKNENTWYMAGMNQGKTYGFLLDKDWRDLRMWPALLLFAILFGYFCYLVMPFYHRAEKTFAAAVFTLALAIRYYFVFIVSPPELSIYSDMAAYYNRAVELSYGSFTTRQLFQPLGFTLWSWLVREFGNWELFKWGQVFLSLGTVYIVFIIAHRHLGKVAAFVALALAAVHMPQVSLATLHLSETLYAFLLTLSFWYLLKISESNKLVGYIGAGFLLTLAFYVRGAHSFFLPLFGLWIFWRDRKNIGRAFLKNFSFAVGCLTLIIPFALWNYKMVGQAAWSPRAGALNFVEGKCPWKDNTDSRGERWMSPLFVFTQETTARKWPRPFSDDKYFWQQGFQCIQENPAVLIESFRSIYYLAAGNPLWPANTTLMRPWMQTWEPLFYYLILPLTFLGVLIRRPQARSFYELSLLMILSLFFTVWFFKSENRFRVPFDGFLIMWSAWALEWIWIFCGTKVALYLIRDWQLKRSAIR